MSSEFKHIEGRYNVYVFTRPEWSAKSRLANVARREKVTAFVRAMLTTIIDAVTRAAERLAPAAAMSCFVCSWSGTEMVSNAREHVHPLRLPSYGTLAEAMRFMARHAAGQLDISGCILIPGDCPTITDMDIVSCIGALTDADVVFTPALDGGYCMLGFAREAAVGALFDLTMGTSQTYSESVRVARDSGLRVLALDARHDVDEIADVALLLQSGAFAANLTLEAAARELLAEVEGGR